MAVARIAEVIGASPKGWQEAVDEAIKRASKTLRGITGIEIVRQNAKVENGKIVEYRTHLNITFILEDTVSKKK